MPSNNFSITLLWNKRARESESLLSNNILQLTTSNYECNVLISTCLSVWRYFLFEVKTSVSSLVSLFPCWSWWLTWGFLLLWRQCGYDPTLRRKSKSKVQARFLIQKLILKKGARFKYRTTFTLKASATVLLWRQVHIIRKRTALLWRQCGKEKLKNKYSQAAAGVE